MPLIKFRGGERALLEAQPNLWTEPTSYLGGLLVRAQPLPRCAHAPPVGGWAAPGNRRRGVSRPR
eukprot:6624334-Prymnesium_polylepis.1